MSEPKIHHNFPHSNQNPLIHLEYSNNNIFTPNQKHFPSIFSLENNIHHEDNINIQNISQNSIIHNQNTNNFLTNNFEMNQNSIFFNNNNTVNQIYNPNKNPNSSQNNPQNNNQNNNNNEYFFQKQMNF